MVTFCAFDGRKIKKQWQALIFLFVITLARFLIPSAIIPTPILRNFAKQSSHQNATSSQYPITIKVNANSPTAADVVRIFHVPNESKIGVSFRPNRTCVDPQLIGRLSGVFLSKIQWNDERSIEDNGELTVEGHYKHHPLPAEYLFIEIIVTMCQQFEMGDDAKYACLVAPENHRLTDENATIELDNSTTVREDTASSIGFWYNKLNLSSITPLYTRYQPPGCRNSVADIEHCTGPVDVTRFDPYEFTFTKPFSLRDQLRDTEGGVCFVGQSHSRVLAGFARGILRQHYIQNISIWYYPKKYAVNLTRSELDLESELQWMQQDCSKVVIGMGQWDASRYGGGPTSFSDYKRLMNESMVVFVKPLRDAHIDVYFRNMHYNPLGDSILECPPTDWRNPNVIDMYTRIIKQLCQEYDVPFIDTGDITHVMWDRQVDWGHFKDVSGELEALYLLHRVFELPVTNITPVEATLAVEE